MIGVPLSEKKTGYRINKNKFLVLSNDPPELMGGGSTELYKYNPQSPGTMIRVLFQLGIW